MSDTKDLSIASDMKLPAHLKQVQYTNADSLETAGESLPRISIKGKMWGFKKNGEIKKLPLGTNLPICIVGISPTGKKALAKVFYASGFVEGSDDPPDCFSRDGVYPDPQSADKQNHACATCEQNKWGSRINDAGKEVKACSDRKELFVVSPGAIAEDKIWLLHVPPASLKALTVYSRALTQQFGANAPIPAIKTIISFDEDAAHPQLIFKFGGFLDEASSNKAMALASSAAIMELIADPAEAKPGDPQPGDQVKSASPIEESQAGDDLGFGEEEAVTTAAAGETFGDTTANSGIIMEGGDDEPAAETVLDKNKVHWDERIHSGNKKMTAKGLWQRRKNITDEVFIAITKELQGGATGAPRSQTVEATTVAASEVQGDGDDFGSLFPDEGEESTELGDDTPDDEIDDILAEFN